MTVLGTKRLVLVAGALTALAMALNLFDLARHKGSLPTALETAPLVPFLVMLFDMWDRLSTLEIEYGQGKIEPHSRQARPRLIRLAVTAAGLGAVAGYLVLKGP